MGAQEGGFVGILHPGEMGSSLGAVLAGHGRKVMWASEGRSEATARRAEAAGMTDAGDLAALAERSEVILSVCPPHAALEVAGKVAALGFGGVYVDANAVSPATARRVGEVVAGGRAGFVDGGIVGPPARPGGYTHLYLSGEGAGKVAGLFEGSDVRTTVLGADPGAASALKMCYAAYTKGTAALVVAIRALAASEGVEEALVAEWEASQPSLAERAGRMAPGIARKAWRFKGEMDEIAAAFEDAGLPGGFHGAAAEIYRRLEDLKGHEASLGDVVTMLLGEAPDLRAT